jgi:hypothetical protein
MHPFTAYALGVAVLGLVVYAVIDAVTKYDKRYNVQNMPGPWQVPWVGRIHDLPIELMWLKFKEWADIYGPIYRTKMLGANFIIITDEKIAEDMLVKKAKLYSDRPEIKSLFDAKSTYGSMEYLPLMGKNRNFIAHVYEALTNQSRILGSSAKVHPLISHRSGQCAVQRHHGIRGQAMAR